jgi:hypothetical protein
MSAAVNPVARLSMMQIRRYKIRNKISRPPANARKSYLAAAIGRNRALS